MQQSNNDFEEFGVDQSTLEEMRQVRGKLREQKTLLKSSFIVANTFSTSPLSQPIAFPHFILSRRIVVVVATRMGSTRQPGRVVGAGRKRG